MDSRSTLAKSLRSLTRRARVVMLNHSSPDAHGELPSSKADRADPVLRMRAGSLSVAQASMASRPTSR